MFYDSNKFHALESGVSAAWQQQQMHMQNAANLETPGYKSKSMVFDEVMSKAQDGQVQKTYRARVVTNDNTTIRPDGNNVDMDKESLEMYKAYVQYSLLMDKVKGQFNNYNAVLNSNMK